MERKDHLRDRVGRLLAGVDRGRDRDSNDSVRPLGLSGLENCAFDYSSKACATSRAATEVNQRLHPQHGRLETVLAKN